MVYDRIQQSQPVQQLMAQLMEMTQCQWFLKQPFLFPVSRLEQEMNHPEEHSMEIQREGRKGKKRRKVSENISLLLISIKLITSTEIMDDLQIEYQPETHSQH